MTYLFLSLNIVNTVAPVPVRGSPQCQHQPSQTRHPALLRALRRQPTIPSMTLDVLRLART